MTLMDALALYTALFRPYLLIAGTFYAIGLIFRVQIAQGASMAAATPKATAVRWAAILLGGPASTFLIAVLYLLFTGALGLESQVLAVAGGIVGAAVLMFLSLTALRAAHILGMLHRIRIDGFRAGRAAAA